MVTVKFNKKCNFGAETLNMVPLILNKIYFVLAILILSGIIVSCSGTRMLEKKQKRAVYERLGLDESKKDNFNLYKESASWINAPYKEGGNNNLGVDCSGLVVQIYQKVYGKMLERNTTQILSKNCRPISKSQLKEGDLVFFCTSSKSKSKVNHVGIYLKEQKFIHASTSKGVIISSLEEIYFHKYWVCGGRVK